MVLEKMGFPSKKRDKKIPTKKKMFQQLGCPLNISGGADMTR